MSKTLIDHAKKEFALLGYEPIESLPEDDINRWVQENVIELLEVFSKQGHSGSSAPYIISMFSKLAKFEIVAPLTGEDDEWGNVRDYGCEPLYQNKRDSRVFKNSDGSCYQIDGIVWKEEDGVCYTNRHSSVHIESFPYTPTTEYRSSSEDPSKN
jgi:hypothetical protein